MIACETVSRLPVHFLRSGMQRWLGPSEDSYARQHYAAFAVWSGAQPEEPRNEGRVADGPWRRTRTRDGYRYRAITPRNQARCCRRLPRRRLRSLDLAFRELATTRPCGMLNGHGVLGPLGRSFRKPHLSGSTLARGRKCVPSPFPGQCDGESARFFTLITCKKSEPQFVRNTVLPPGETLISRGNTPV